MADDYSYWATERAGPLPLPSPYMPCEENVDLPYQLHYGLHTSGVYQAVNQELDAPSQPISPLSFSEVDSDFKVDWSDIIRQNFQCPKTAKSTSVEIDAISPTVSERGGSNSDSSHSSMQEEGKKTAKRRTQNRAAQRRFRERRDEQNKHLQEKAAELEKKYAKIDEQLNQRLEEASRLQSENESLKTEIQNLRQRWRTMVHLLQRPNSLQFLSVLVGGEQMTSTSSSQEAGLPPVEDSDGYLRCLDALILPDKS
ncbi:hypothetical protein BDV12DRAFT_200258 [Aspergillus spectabilis]